jgi:tripartite-type tricarboxylate transporter receptor subunit TctC
MVPAGTPKPIVDRLYIELAVILKSPDIVEQMKQGGLFIDGSMPAQYALKVREDIARWAKLIKATGVTAAN